MRFILGLLFGLLHTRQKAAANIYSHCDCYNLLQAGTACRRTPVPQRRSFFIDAVLVNEQALSRLDESSRDLFVNLKTSRYNSSPPCPT